MNVVLASDDNYAFLLGGCLVSLFESNKDIEQMDVYIISDHISTESLTKIMQLGELYGRKLIILDPPEMSSEIVVSYGLNISSYYRLMLASIIPENVDKILYLDVDVLIRGNLSELWNTDISEYLIAGVEDTIGRFGRESIGLKCQDIYVNAGVLLINLKKWRELNLAQSFLEYIEDMNWEVEFNDQGVINHVCTDRTKLVSPRYNFLPSYQRYSRKQLGLIKRSQVPYSENDLKESKHDPVIVHFAGYPFSRPWFEGVNTRFGNSYVDCIKRSGVNFTPRHQPSNLHYILVKTFFKMPGFVCARAEALINYIHSRKIESIA